MSADDRAIWSPSILKAAPLHGGELFPCSFWVLQHFDVVWHPQPRAYTGTLMLKENEG